MMPNTDTAAICGLFCGTCPCYPEECHGCLSNKLAFGCDTCGNGFRQCAREHDVERCYECTSFPCERLEHFKDQHVVNGIGHHKNVIKDLNIMKDQGVDSWVEEQTKKNLCSSCGKLLYWYDLKCHNCGHPIKRGQGKIK